MQETEYLDEIEEDDFDEIATHLAVTGKGGAVLGTVRLVPHSRRGFPLERYTSAAIRAETASTTVEVSRLAVPRSLGGRRSRLAREVGLQLFRSVYAVAKGGGATDLIAAMEPPLVRILKSFDIPMREIGPVVDFGGPVRPFTISVAEFDAIHSEVAQFFRSDVPLTRVPKGSLAGASEGKADFVSLAAASLKTDLETSTA